MPPPSPPHPHPATPPPTSAKNRSLRLFQEASQHNEAIDAQYPSLNLLHSEGRAGRRRKGRRRRTGQPRVAKYLRESQPKSKYITDPAQLSGPGQQDLQSAAFLIKELDQGRIERLRRFQPKARSRNRRRNRKRKKKQAKPPPATKIPTWLTGIHLGAVDKETRSDEKTAEEHVSPAHNSMYKRLKEDPHAQAAEHMNFINKPSSYCKTQAAQMETKFTALSSTTPMTLHMKHLMSEMFTMLDRHDRTTSDNYCTSSNSIWSSLPSTLENQLIQPTLAAYRKDLETELEEQSENFQQPHGGSGGGSGSLSEKLTELQKLKNSSFEEQVENVVHGILAWYFKIYGTNGHQGVGSSIRSGRASVVKRYQELIQESPQAIQDLVSITRNHGALVDKHGVQQHGEGKDTQKNFIQLNVLHSFDTPADVVVDGKHNKNKTKTIDFIEQNKQSKALAVQVPVVLKETLNQSSAKRRSSVIMVRKRRQSMILEKREDIQYRKEQRLERINIEMNKAIEERRIRMFSSMLCTVIFWNKTTAGV